MRGTVSLGLSIAAGAAAPQGEAADVAELLYLFIRSPCASSTLIKKLRHLLVFRRSGDTWARSQTSGDNVDGLC